jgi:hypothetical protein
MTCVALYSTIWSIKLSNKQTLGLPVKWQWLSVAIILITGISALLIHVDSKSNGNIFRTFVEIAGYILSFFFGVIVLN